MVILNFAVYSSFDIQFSYYREMTEMVNLLKVILDVTDFSDCRAVAGNIQFRTDILDFEILN